MNYETETRKNYAVPVLAGTFRFLCGLAVIFAGLYLAAYSSVRGHELGLLLIIGSPFIMLKDDK